MATPTPSQLATQIQSLRAAVATQVPRQAVFATTHMKRLWAALVQIYGGINTLIGDTKNTELEGVWIEGWVSYEGFRNVAVKALQRLYDDLEAYWGRHMAKYRRVIAPAAGEYLLLPDDNFGPEVALFLDKAMATLAEVGKNQSYLQKLLSHGPVMNALITVANGVTATWEAIKYIGLKLPLDAYKKAKEAMAWGGDLIKYAIWGGAAYLGWQIYKGAR